MEKRKPLIITLAVVATVAGLLLVAGGTPGELDRRMFRLLNGSIRNALFDILMPVITDFRKWRAIVILIWSGLVLFGGTRGRWAALVLIPLVVASDQISSHALKPLLARLRPCEVLGNVHLWYGKEGWITTPIEVVRSYKSSFSFPSSHAANITASMLFLGLVYRRILALSLTFALLVSLSRVYIGVHWPLDVLSGMALGALLGWLAFVLFRKVTQSVRDRVPSE